MPQLYWIATWTNSRDVGQVNFCFQGRRCQSTETETTPNESRRCPQKRAASLSRRADFINVVKDGRTRADSRFLLAANFRFHWSSFPEQLGGTPNHVEQIFISLAHPLHRRLAERERSVEHHETATVRLLDCLGFVDCFLWAARAKPISAVLIACRRQRNVHQRSRRSSQYRFCDNSGRSGHHGAPL